ncbi:ABC transporter substrate-binding protein, partial [Faecalibaculum rodentium]|uniref:ABC transporter substrate-binding protein n=1 Tax=Faecalibaculum rodentium TaxID=1702221 RepID=UPI002590E643
MKKYFAVPAVMTLALGLTACSSGSGNTGAKDGEKPAQVLNLSKENDVITMDSTLATDGMSFEVINMCIEGLETTNENADIVPALAESYDVSDDDLTYTFHLRDAKWSNGDPVTAADFEYAWKDAATDPTCDYAYIFGSDGACIKGADEAMGDPAKKVECSGKAVDVKSLDVPRSRNPPY